MFVIFSIRFQKSLVTNHNKFFQGYYSFIAVAVLGFMLHITSLQQANTINIGYLVNLSNTVCNSDWRSTYVMKKHYSHRLLSPI